MRIPLVFTGIALAGRSTRRPVAEVLSGRVNRLLGNGSRQGVELYGWQSAAGFAAADLATAREALAPAPATATIASTATSAIAPAPPTAQSFRTLMNCSSLCSERRIRASAPGCRMSGAAAG